MRQKGDLRMKGIIPWERYEPLKRLPCQECVRVKRQRNWLLGAGKLALFILDKAAPHIPANSPRAGRTFQLARKELRAAIEDCVGEKIDLGNTYDHLFSESD